MGCVGSKSVSEEQDHVRRLENIIGGEGNNELGKVDIASVPVERRSMLGVEMAASKRTIYYQRNKTFEAEGSLRFDEDPAMAELRGFLDEPLGRYYLLEFTKEKKLVDLERLTLAWTKIFKIQGIKLGEKPEKDDDEIGSDAEDVDDADTRKDANGFSIAQLMDEDTVFSLSTAIIENHLMPDAPMFLRFTNISAGEGIREETRMNAQKILDACRVLVVPDPPAPNVSSSTDLVLNVGDDAAMVETSSDVPNEKKYTYEGDLATKETLKLCFGRLQRAIFREMVSLNFCSSFKEHSEYKRYLLKFQKVYNAITHHDFDYMGILGKGSFGRVFRIRKKTTGRQYALKVMSKRKILSGTKNAAQVTIERNVLVMCNCRSIVRPYFAFQTNRALFLILELLEGGNMVEAMERCGGKMTLNVVRFHTAQIILGLNYLHDHGILFRDLKPLNVMIDRKGNAVLTDMGLCIRYQDTPHYSDTSGEADRNNSETQTSTDLRCVGTYGFRAPEMLEADKSKAGYGPPVDYWALGITVFFTLEGKPPYRSRSLALIGPQKSPKDLEKEMQKQEVHFPSDFAPELVSLVTGLLQKDPKKRLGYDRNALRNHPFFKGIDWSLLEAGKLISPFKPKIPHYPPDEKPQFDGLAGAMAQFSMNENLLEIFGGEKGITEEYRHVGRKDQKLFRNWGFADEDELDLEWKVKERRKTSTKSPSGSAKPPNGVSLAPSDNESEKII